MSNIIYESENILFDYIMKCLTVKEMKELWIGRDILQSITYDAEEEIKNEVWEIIKQNLDYSNIIFKVKEHLKNVADSSDEEDEETTENQESDSDNNEDE